MAHRIRDLLDDVPVINYITIIKPTVGYRWRDSRLMISVYISQHPSTSPSYASRLQQPPHGAIYVQQCKAISSSRTAGQSDMDKEALHIPGRLYGTHLH